MSCADSRTYGTYCGLLIQWGTKILPKQSLLALHIPLLSGGNPMPNAFCTPNDTIPILLKHKGFLESIIQPVFWKSHNPQIAKELESSSLLAGFEQLGASDERGLDIVCHVIQHFTLSANEYDKVEWRPGGASVMENVATTRVKPRGETVFVEGLIHILPRLAKEYKGPAFRLLFLSVGLSCVDKGVINSAVEFADKYVSTNEDAVCITQLLGMILMPSKTGKCYPDDGRFGVAIGRGLLQVCLELLTKFRHSDVGTVVEGDVKEIVLGASMVVFLNKTSKAVSIQRESILKSLKNFEAAHERETGASSSKNEASIIPTMKSIVYLSSKFQKSTRPGIDMKVCSGCKALLDKGKVKQCAACKVVVYCSPECQKRDWDASHKLECKELANSDDSVNLSHGMMNERISERSLYGNIAPAGSEILLSNMANVFMQASLQKLDLTSDCVIVVSMVCGPPIVRVHSTKDFLARCKETSSVNLLRGKRSRSIVCCFIASGKGGGTKKVTVFQELLPGCLRKSQTWKEAQDECAREYAEVIEEHTSDDIGREAYLKELMHTVRLDI